MLKWQVDFLLATNAILECTDRICMNYGTCLNFGAFTSNHALNENCVCADGFFGPNCEYADDDLVTSGLLSHDVLSIVGDENRNHKSDYSVDGENYENQPEYETRHKTVEVIETEEVSGLEIEEVNVPGPKFRSDRRLSRRKRNGKSKKGKKLQI